MLTPDYQIHLAISGLTEEEAQFNEDTQLDCPNCFTAIPKWILEDAGEIFFLGDYDCENCGEPLN